MDSDYRRELLHAVAEWKGILRKAERTGAVSATERRELMTHIGSVKQVLYAGVPMPSYSKPGKRRPE